MTGEITLRGKVLPVGGIRDKVLAAHRAGIRTVILPEKNRKDLEEVPDTVRKDVKLVFAEPDGQGAGHGAGQKEKDAVQAPLGDRGEQAVRPHRKPAPSGRNGRTGRVRMPGEN